MFLLLYTIALRLYALIIKVVALRNPKARQWAEGRKAIFQRIREKIEENTSPIVWFHSASLGEFEQARPVIEQFRGQYPAYKILLTFFSPSGYEVRKNYAGADYVFYLPLDSRKNARQFISMIKPKAAFFAKYEFWYYYLTELRQQAIPVLSFSAIFRPQQAFFKPYGGFFRGILRNFTHVFVQNEESKQLLNSIGLRNVTVAGDTRFDRVSTVASQRKEIPVVAAFKGDHKLLVIGSSWMQDMDVVIPMLNRFPHPLKVVIAPHELHQDEMQRLEKELKGKIVRFSQVQVESVHNADVLIIDNIGMLSSIYSYADFAYIGGGFGKGIHNILEAATFGMPVFSDPGIRNSGRR